MVPDRYESGTQLFIQGEVREVILEGFVKEEMVKGKRTQKRHFFLWCSMGVAMLLLAVLTVAFGLPVSVKKAVVVCELGESVSDEPEAYVTGNPLAMGLTWLDMSAVNTMQAGTYEAWVHHGFQKESFVVLVKDTTPPVLTLKQENIYLQTGVPYGPETFIDYAEDNSGEITFGITLFSGEKAKGDRICCDSMGTQQVTITAQDRYGNETTCSMEVLADAPPEITGYQEYYVAEGNSVTFSTEGILAQDAIDGDLSNRIKIDTADVDVNREGIYEVIYSATDRYGFSTEVTVPVNVMPAEELQELINTHRINRLEQHIVGAYNLYDGGVFEEDNVQQVLEAMEPALVVVTNSVGRGSGFIVKITDTDVIICTNLHVTENRSDHSVIFHNGECVHGVLAGSMDKIDVSFLKVSRENISADLLDTLMTVHIDAGYLDSITDPEDVQVGFRTLETDGSIWRDEEGILVELKEPFTYQAYGEDRLHGNLEYVTQVTAPSFHGASGSAIFDGHGNLIAMASFYYYDADINKRLYYGMTVEDILKGYRQIFGEALNYQ